MRRLSSRPSVLPAAAAAAVAVAIVAPVLASQATPRPEPVVLAWCYEVTVELPSWQPSFEVCNLPEIGGGLH